MRKVMYSAALPAAQNNNLTISANSELRRSLYGRSRLEKLVKGQSRLEQKRQSLDIDFRHNPAI